MTDSTIVFLISGFPVPALDNNGKIIIKNNFCAIRAEGRIGWTYIDNVTELTEKMSRGDFIWEKKP